MKNHSDTKPTNIIKGALRSLALSSACLALSACGSGYHLRPGQVFGTIPSSTKLYTLDGTNNRILQYTPDLVGAAEESASIDLPSGLTPILVATDALGKIYVGGFTTNVNQTEVVVYAPGLSSATPLRTVGLEWGKITALAVDPTGQIFVGQLNVLASIKVYSPTASGTSSAIRTLAPANYRYIDDVAVDTSGNLYVSVYNGGAYLIDTWGTGDASAPNHTLVAPAGSYFGGIAVDSKGDIFAMEQLTIAEFAAGSNGTPVPIAAINLPAPTAPYTQEAFSNVLRRDGDGNYFVPMTMSNATSSINNVYAFTPAQSGDAVPILVFTATNATVATPLGINIALTVF